MSSYTLTPAPMLIDPSVRRTVGHLEDVDVTTIPMEVTDTHNSNRTCNSQVQCISQQQLCQHKLAVTLLALLPVQTHMHLMVDTRIIWQCGMPPPCLNRE